MATLKYSRQRESIKNFLISRYDHPTADMVYSHVKEEFPNISLGTVYRNLSLLTELGEISKITIEGADRYDAHIEPHAHFICRKCQAVMDINLKDENLIDREGQEDFRGIIEGHSIQYYGLCPDCRKKEAAESAEKEEK